MDTTHERVMPGWIDAHFAGKLAPRDERLMRQHLAGCRACQRRYRRQLVFERLDPDGLGPTARLARGLGLGLGRPRRLTLGRLSLAAALLLGLSVLLLLQLRPSSDVGGGPGSAGYAARGALDGAVALRVYRVSPGQPARLARGQIAPNDELAFGYLNAAGKRHLMVLGEDETGAIYWFHPAWSDAGQDPAAIPIQGGPQLHELPEAITHTYRGRTLRIHALFLDRPTTVQQVEALVRADPGAARLSIAGSLQETLILEVRR